MLHVFLFVCFKIFSLILFFSNLAIMYLVGVLFAFILPDGMMDFILSWEIFTCYSFILFCLYALFSFPFHDSNYMYVRSLDIFSQFYLRSIYFLHFPPFLLFRLGNFYCQITDSFTSLFFCQFYLKIVFFGLHLWRVLLLGIEIWVEILFQHLKCHLIILCHF